MQDVLWPSEADEQVSSLILKARTVGRVDSEWGNKISDVQCILEVLEVRIRSHSSRA